MPVLALESGEVDTRFWILKEETTTGTDNCRAGECPSFQDFTTRLFNPRDRTQLDRIMALLDFQNAANGLPLEHPEAPEFCAAQLPGPNEVIWNPEWLEMSHKLESLRGLEGIHVDVSGLKAPVGFKGEFGALLQEAVETKFRAAGIRIVDKEEVMRIPGQPKLAVYFSATNPDSGCWWSVFATMTQTAVLTRNIHVKLNVGSWAFMKGYDVDSPDATEFAAINEVFDQFVADFKAAHDPEFVPVNQPPIILPDGREMLTPDIDTPSYQELLEQAADAPPEEAVPEESDENAPEGEAAPEPEGVETEPQDDPAAGATGTAEHVGEGRGRGRTDGDSEGRENAGEGAGEKTTTAGG